MSSNWTGADLRASREALGLSQSDLAGWLKNAEGNPWTQDRVSKAEKQQKYRYVPDWVVDQMLELEAMQDDLIDMMLEGLESGHRLFVHPDAASYMNRHPGEPHINASLQRTAAAWAIREYEAEHGKRPSLHYWGMDIDGEKWPEET